MVAHLSAVAATWVRIPASCENFYKQYKKNTRRSRGPWEEKSKQIYIFKNCLICSGGVGAEPPLHPPLPRLRTLPQAAPQDAPPRRVREGPQLCPPPAHQWPQVPAGPGHRGHARQPRPFPTGPPRQRPQLSAHHHRRIVFHDDVDGRWRWREEENVAVSVCAGGHAAAVRPGRPDWAGHAGADDHPGAAAHPGQREHVHHDGGHPAEGQPHRLAGAGEEHAGVHALGSL